LAIIAIAALPDCPSGRIFSFHGNGLRKLAGETVEL